MPYNKKKLLALVLSLALMLSATSCANADISSTPTSDITTSLSSSDVSSDISEYPSSENELSSNPSSEISSIVSNIDKVNTSSKPNSSKPNSSKPNSSKPNSSKPNSSKPNSSTPPLVKPPVSNSDEQMKAAWLSFLEFQQFAGSSEANFTSKIQTYFDTMVNKGLNTIMAQVRPHGDAFYESKYYPWSKCISGTMGQSVDYDPLAIMVAEAHSRGLSIHAWINPYRTMTDKEIALIDDSYPLKQWYSSGDRASYMVQIPSDSRWWLKPGNKEVQKLIVNGAKEIAQNYAVDGIHLDDYFYGGDLWRYGDDSSTAKANTTALVKSLYNGIKSVNSSVLFGISPAGGFRENNVLPNSDLGYLSTDLKLWCQNPGYIDYVMPQLYWSYEDTRQPYTMSLQKWEDFVTQSSVKLYIGLAPYRLDKATIEKQIADIANSGKATGYCLFRYDHIHALDLK